jgi:hypothetical protein
MEVGILFAILKVFFLNQEKLFFDQYLIDMEKKFEF